MAAIKMELLVELEKKAGLEPDGLSYQERCSRITAVQKGETWQGVKTPQIKSIASSPLTPEKRVHPLWGKRLLISPMMTPDKNRSLYYDEELGPEMVVEEQSAGQLIYDQSAEQVQRLSADYKIISKSPNRTVTAKTSIPKIGQEISWDISKEIVPVVRGNDGQRGYMWILPVHLRQYEDCVIQVYGLKTIIETLYPELLPKFSGKPVMSYIDGFVLAASIPQTDAILKEHRRKELQDAKLGLV